MQKSCNREGYVLSSERKLSAFLSEKCVPFIKKPIMTTLLPKTALENATLTRSRGRMPYVPKAIVDKRPKERYYSLLVPSEKDISPFISVLHGTRNDVLRINFVCMAVYECYLYAFGLPSNFPKEQIIVLGDDRVKYIPCRSCQYGGKHLYEYELTVPASTEREEYQQRIINDFNQHFQLDVNVEKLSIVKESRPIGEDGKSVELIWDEQITMIMRKKPTLTLEK
jgi:hypothetical protein